jgi:site-specific DNA-methyltransferase (adenine-specific)
MSATPLQAGACPPVFWGNRLLSERNKTINLTADEAARCLSQCLTRDELGTDKPYENRVIFGDTFEAMKKLPKGFADLIIADPPYNLSKKYGETGFLRKSGEDYRLFTEKWLDAALPLLGKNGSIYVCSDWESSLIIGAALCERLFVKNRISWQREKGRGAAKNWKNSMEDIFFGTVSESDYTFNLESVKMRRRVIAPYREDNRPKDWFETKAGKFRDTCPSNFWDDITVPFWSMSENTDHPAQKPEKLAAKLILASSNPGEIIFDPFLGSGTTAAAAIKLGRRFVGIEREAEYAAAAVFRAEKAKSDKRIQGYEDGVFWERNAL